ncbi:MAG: cell division protein FtsA [Candidatus Omnitrophica bacterium]|nr:cell division protein FtsA [Candidatus Omnitrophota bacterium]
MLQTFKGEKLSYGLDLGVQTMKASLVRTKDSENLELLGVHEVKTVGLKGAAVSDLNELSDCIQRAVSGLVNKTGFRVKTLNIGMGGDLVTVRESGAVIPLVDHGNKVINAQDVKKVKQQARLLGVHLEEEIIHDFAKCFKVDDVNTAINPAGLYGRKLSGSFLLVITNLTRMRNIAKAVNQAGFELGQIYFSSYAASQVALDQKSRKDGIAFIDVGSTSTAVLFYKDGLLQQIELIPWGGVNVTQSIAGQLSLVLDLAEDIKKSHAVAHKTSESEEEILVKRETGYMPIKRIGISKAIGPEIDKFVDMVQKVIKDSPNYHHLNAGVVMVGGGSLLPGLIERIEEATNLRVTSGVPTKGLNNSALYAGVIGLAQMSSIDAINSAIAAQAPKNWTTRLTNSFKELYQEYF